MHTYIKYALLVLVALLLSSTIGMQAETKLKVEFTFENAEFDGFDNEKELQDKYNDLWETKKKAFVREFIQTLDKYLAGHGYTLVQEGEADYTLWVNIRSLDMDAEITAKAILSGNEEISRRRYKVGEENSVDSYLDMQTNTFGELADAVYRNQFRGQLLHDNLPSSKPKKVITDVLLEVKGVGDIQKSVDYSDGWGYETSCNLKIKDLLYVGAGYGIAACDYYYDDMYAAPVFPVFGQVKYFLWNKRVSPFVSSQLGYTFGKVRFKSWYEPDWAKDKKKFNLGLFYQVGLGVRVGLKRGALQAEWGYKHQCWDCKLKERDFVNFSVGYSVTIYRE